MKITDEEFQKNCTEYFDGIKGEVKKDQLHEDSLDYINHQLEMIFRIEKKLQERKFALLNALKKIEDKRTQIINI